jgi:hypothetical protein
MASDESAQPPKPAEAGTPAPAEPELAPYMIEGARSSRSKCKTCRKKIEKDTLRLGVLIEGPYGIGYLWHHLTCAAKRRLDDVEAAYDREAWKEAKEPPQDVPTIEEMRKVNEEAEEKREQRKKIPFAEVDPSGRAKCKYCDEVMEKGSLRVVLGREIEFGSQYRTMPIHVHLACVAGEIEKVDCSTLSEGFEYALRQNSHDLTPMQVDELLKDIGELPDDPETDNEDAPPF